MREESILKKVLVMLAEGFEEIEAVTPVDLLRRAGVDCKLVSITNTLQVKGAHSIVYQADELFDEKACSEADGIILPGGMPGTLNLQKHEGLQKALEQFYKQGKYICAICAAPMILGSMGMLSGKTATIYPGMENHLVNANVSQEVVCMDGSIITSRAPGTAFPFALELVKIFAGEQKKEELIQDIVFHD